MMAEWGWIMVVGEAATDIKWEEVTGCFISYHSAMNRNPVSLLPYAMTWFKISVLLRSNNSEPNGKESFVDES